MPSGATNSPAPFHFRADQEPLARAYTDLLRDGHNRALHEPKQPLLRITKPTKVALHLLTRVGFVVKTPLDAVGSLYNAFSLALKIPCAIFKYTFGWIRMKDGQLLGDKGFLKDCGLAELARHTRNVILFVVMSPVSILVGLISPRGCVKMLAWMGLASEKNPTLKSKPDPTPTPNPVIIDPKPTPDPLPEPTPPVVNSVVTPVVPTPVNSTLVKLNGPKLSTEGEKLMLALRTLLSKSGAESITAYSAIIRSGLIEKNPALLDKFFRVLQKNPEPLMELMNSGILNDDPNALSEFLKAHSSSEESDTDSDSEGDVPVPPPPALPLMSVTPPPPAPPLAIDSDSANQTLGFLKEEQNKKRTTPFATGLSLRKRIEGVKLKKVSLEGLTSKKEKMPLTGFGALLENQLEDFKHIQGKSSDDSTKSKILSDDAFKDDQDSQTLTAGHSAGDFSQPSATNTTTTTTTTTTQNPVPSGGQSPQHPKKKATKPEKVFKLAGRGRKVDHQEKAQEKLRRPDINSKTKSISESGIRVNPGQGEKKILNNLQTQVEQFLDGKITLDSVFKMYVKEQEDEAWDDISELNLKASVIKKSSVIDPVGDLHVFLVMYLTTQRMKDKLKGEFDQKTFKILKSNVDFKVKSPGKRGFHIKDFSRLDSVYRLSEKLDDAKMNSLHNRYNKELTPVLKALNLKCGGFINDHKNINIQSKGKALGFLQQIKSFELTDAEWTKGPQGAKAKELFINLRKIAISGIKWFEEIKIDNLNLPAYEIIVKLIGDTQSLSNAPNAPIQPSTANLKKKIKEFGQKQAADKKARVESSPEYRLEQSLLNISQSLFNLFDGLVNQGKKLKSQDLGGVLDRIESLLGGQMTVLITGPGGTAEQNVIAAKEEKRKRIAGQLTQKHNFELKELFKSKEFLALITKENVRLTSLARALWNEFQPFGKEAESNRDFFRIIGKMKPRQKSSTGSVRTKQPSNKKRGVFSGLLNFFGGKKT